jgi:hypothetical protein
MEMKDQFIHLIIRRNVAAVSIVERVVAIIVIAAIHVQYYK